MFQRVKACETFLKYPVAKKGHILTSLTALYFSCRVTAFALMMNFNIKLLKWFFKIGENSFTFTHMNSSIYPVCSVCKDTWHS